MGREPYATLPREKFSGPDEWTGAGGCSTQSGSSDLPMPASKDFLPEDFPFDLLLEGVSTIFESLGRALICLNSGFRIVHASAGLNHLMGEGTVESVTGKRAADVFGSDLFGPDGSMRKALQAGERREGWGASIQIEDGPPRLVSITAAPIVHDNSSVCDPRVSYVVVVRLGEETSTAVRRRRLSSPDSSPARRPCWTCSDSSSTCRRPTPQS